MSLSAVITCLKIRPILTTPFSIVQILKSNYAKAPASFAPKSKKKMKLGPVVEKKVLPVETDVNKLVNFVCGSNILKEGKDIELKPDSEYPEWLWTLRTGKAPTLEELDPNTKQYWRRLRTIAERRNNTLRKVKRF